MTAGPPTPCQGGAARDMQRAGQTTHVYIYIYIYIHVKAKTYLGDCWNSRPEQVLTFSLVKYR